MTEAGLFMGMMHFPLPSAGKFERKGELFKFKYDEVDW